MITVAGTNGKGSTVKTLEAVLTWRRVTRLAPTPLPIYSASMREFVRGEEAADGDIVACFARIEAVREPESLSYFEFTTLAALLLFADKCVDFALLEVGLGGRLDAVNLIDPDCCIITNIALDHEDWLGKGRENIGAEKAGILRADTPFVFCDRDPPASVLAQCVVPQAHANRYRGVPMSVPMLVPMSPVEAPNIGVFRGQARNGEVITRDALPIPNLFLDNVVGALQGLACLDLLPAEEILRRALNDLGLVGRFEKRRDLTTGRRVILDAAHNVAAAELLARRLKTLFPVPTPARRPKPETPAIRLVLAAMSDKNIEDIVRALDPLVDIWYIAAFEGSRAAGAQEIHTRVSTALPKAMIRPFDSVYPLIVRPVVINRMSMP